MKRKRIFLSLIVALIIGTGGLIYEIGVPVIVKGKEIEESSSIDEISSSTTETSSSVSSTEESSFTTETTKEDSSTLGETEASSSTTTTVGGSLNTSSSGSQTSSEKNITGSSSFKETAKSTVSKEKESIEEEKAIGTNGTSTTTPKDTSTIRFVRNQTTAQFVAAVGENAQLVAEEQDLYASVMLAQAILESASGNSSLASPPNYNLFGIKGSYQGASASFATQEDNGAGQYYTIQASFRKYPSYKESLEDYAKLLHSSFYQGAWKSQTNNYQEVTQFLTGRYATDTRYAEKLNALIETYELTKYDEKLEPERIKEIKGSISNEQVKMTGSPAFQNQVIDVEPTTGIMFPSANYRLEKQQVAFKKNGGEITPVNKYKVKDVLGNTRVN